MLHRSIHRLGETELEVLNIVWDRGEATVSDVRKQILEYRKVAHTTIMTVMKNLADKGYLSFKKRGNSYVYSAKKPAYEVRRSILRDLVSKVFSDSPRTLVRALVEDENLTPDELEEIKSIIRSMDREEGADD